MSKKNGIDELLADNAVVNPSNIEELIEALSDEKFEVANEHLIIIVNEVSRLSNMLNETINGISGDFRRLRDMVKKMSERKKNNIITFD